MLALLVALASTWRDSVLLAVIDAISVLAIATPVAYFVVMFRSRKVDDQERTHLAAYIPLWVGAVVFWMIFEQAAAHGMPVAEVTLWETENSFATYRPTPGTPDAPLTMREVAGRA